MPYQNQPLDLRPAMMLANQETPLAARRRVNQENALARLQGLQIMEADEKLKDIRASRQQKNILAELMMDNRGDFDTESNRLQSLSEAARDRGAPALAMTLREQARKEKKYEAEQAKAEMEQQQAMLEQLDLATKYHKTPEQFASADPMIQQGWHKLAAQAVPAAADMDPVAAFDYVRAMRGIAPEGSYDPTKPDVVDIPGIGKGVRTGEKSLKVIESGGGRGGNAFGNSLEGVAYSTVTRVEQMKRAGQKIPDDLMIEYQTAKHILQREKFQIDAEGNRIAYTPGLPSFGGAAVPPPERTQPEAQMGGAISTPGGGTITTIQEKDDEYDKALRTSRREISRIADILNEAKMSGEIVTGLEGQMKAEFGGAGRQAGMNISPKAEQLQTALTRLQGAIGPLMLNEKRLSETERARLEKIVGQITWKQDDVSLRNKLMDLVDFLEEVNSE